MNISDPALFSVLGLIPKLGSAIIVSPVLGEAFYHLLQEAGEFK